MATYIIINRHSGYIDADSRTIGGQQPTGPEAALVAFLRDIGYDAQAQDISSAARSDAAAEYDVYRLDSAEELPIVEDGTRREVIEAVERVSEFCGSYRWDRDRCTGAYGQVESTI